MKFGPTPKSKESKKRFAVTIIRQFFQQQNINEPPCLSAGLCHNQQANCLTIVCNPKSLMPEVFKLKSAFVPRGDQPQAIQKLVAGLSQRSLLYGVTGSGKTFTIANVIAAQSKQVLILSPNKTLAAQLYEEFCQFFPDNKVCYFVSYYDYYQPECYVASTDTYVAKETKINPEIERMRLDTTASIINRQDTIVVASVSAIYSLGSPVDYREMTLRLKVGDKVSRKELCTSLVSLQYLRNDVERGSATFQAQGNTVRIDLPYMKDGLRIEIVDEKIARLDLFDKLNLTFLGELDNAVVFPAKHFVVAGDRKNSAIAQIRKDLKAHLETIQEPLFRERIRTRVNHDLAMLEATGYCSGIENYSVYFDGRKPGERPYCLFDFFEKDFLLIIDESHIAIPQLGAMYNGDRSRKKTLVDYGFRMPSAYDNRPLKFNEIELFFHNTIFVSATPGIYELEQSNCVVEQIVRPTGIVDPEIILRPRVGQMDDLLARIKATSKQDFRTLVTVLTKKSAEQLALFLEEKGLRVCYMHSEIKTQQRTELINQLRSGEFECLVGINLLREGLDLPEVALVAIIDADIEGFLRDARSLIQTIGRAARNILGQVVLYADKVTGSMQKAMQETTRRRAIQTQFNAQHKIVAQSTTRKVVKTIVAGLKDTQQSAPSKKGWVAQQKQNLEKKSQQSIDRQIKLIEKRMQAAAKRKDYELAIVLRDKLKQLKSQ
jgi:excinuclease ABC subunit B